MINLRNRTRNLLFALTGFSMLATGCNSSPSGSAQGNAETSSSTPAPPAFDVDFRVHDWRYVDYIFYFVEGELGEGTMNSLISTVKRELGGRADACVSQTTVDTFDLADVAERLKYTLGSYLSEDKLNQLEGSLESNLPLDLSGEFGAFVFPSDNSAVKVLLDWWKSKCGDRVRGSFTSTTTTTPPASTVPYSQRSCADIWRDTGESYLPQKCKPVTRSNCRVRSQELIWDSFSSSYKTLSTYQIDLAFPDGTSARSFGQTYMIPC